MVSNAPGLLHRPLAARMLHNYLNLGGDLVLNQREMGQVISAGKGSNLRDVPQRLRLDVLQASAGRTEGQTFSTTANPSVTEWTTYPARDGKSRTGQPRNDGQELTPFMQIKPGWIRFVSNDVTEPDYPGSAANVFYGLGSFDTRIEGKVISGYRCFNIYVYDRYMFAESGKGIGLGPIYVSDKNMALLNRHGMGKSFDITGVWQGCFLPPGPLSNLECRGLGYTPYI